MTRKRLMMLLCLVSALAVCLLGCGKEADESKPISEVKAEAEKLDTDALRAKALACKESILAKQKEVSEIAAKIKEIPLTEALGQKAMDLKAEMDTLNGSLAALKERFELYYNKLKENSGDVSGLRL